MQWKSGSRIPNGIQAVSGPQPVSPFPFPKNSAFHTLTHLLPHFSTGSEGPHVNHASANMYGTHDRWGVYMGALEHYDQNLTFFKKTQLPSYRRSCPRPPPTTKAAKNPPLFLPYSSLFLLLLLSPSPPPLLQWLRLLFSSSHSLSFSFLSSPPSPPTYSSSWRR